MTTLHLICYVFAFVCETLAAVGIPSGRYNLVGAGLAFYFITLIF